MKLLRWLAGAELGAEMAGDLEEERRRRAAASPAGARLWRWRATAGLMAYFAAFRLGALARAGGHEAIRLAGTPGPELRRAARSLRRTPWYAATITGVVALTIALASTVFAVIDGVLFKPLPYPEADRLFAIQPGFQDPSARGTPSVSPRELEAWQAAMPDVQFTGFDRSPAAMIEGPNDPELGLALVQPDFFAVLGVVPLAGGLHAADFARASGWPRLVISYELWQQRFGGDPDIVGRDVDADPRIGRLQIAGVMPRDFVLPDRSKAHVLTAPAGLANSPTSRSLTVLARAPQGIGAEALRDRLEVVMGSLAEGQPVAPDGRRFLGPFDRATVVPLETWMTERSAPLFRALAAAVIGLILIASLNVSGLTAARVVDRARDIALRRAVGARSTDIAREHLIGQAVLFSTGTALGLALAVPMLKTSLVLLPDDLHLLKTPAVDARVIALTAAAMAVSLILSSIWPLQRAVRVHRNSLGVVSGSATPRTRSVGRFLVVSGQVAGALVLVVAGALLVGSLMRVQANEIGFSADRRLAVIDLALIGAPGRIGGAHPDVAGQLARFLDDVRSVPGVAAAGAAEANVLERSSFEAVALRSANLHQAHAVGVPVTPGFFRSAGLHLLEGRLPTDDELRTGAPLAVISRRYAAAGWPDMSALGQELSVSLGTRSWPPHTVLGVVEDVRFRGWDLDADTEAFVPHSSLYSSRTAAVFVRAQGSAERLIPDLLRLAERHGPALRVARAAPAADMLADTIRPRRLQSWLFGSFAAAALAITGVGLLGLVASAAARRTREVGVRMALGATRSRLVRQLVREQLAGVSVGLAAGSLLAIWTAPLLRSYLYELSAYDLRVWTAALLAVALTALAGALIPSLRASQVDPVQALRVE
jgi:predicted permease